MLLPFDSAPQKTRYQTQKMLKSDKKNVLTKIFSNSTVPVPVKNLSRSLYNPQSVHPDVRRNQIVGGTNE